jgi:hypothetical protein
VRRGQRFGRLEDAKKLPAGRASWHRSRCAGSRPVSSTPSTFMEAEALSHLFVVGVGFSS